EPAPGSEYPWHQISSAGRIVGRKRFFCSSVPQCIRVGPSNVTPLILTPEDTPMRPNSSLKMACSITEAPRPPYSFGHQIPIQPPSWSFLCQVFCRSERACGARSSSPQERRPPGTFASSHILTSWRNCSSVGELRKSICPPHATTDVYNLFPSD